MFHGAFFSDTSIDYHVQTSATERDRYVAPTHNIYLRITTNFQVGKIISFREATTSIKFSKYETLMGYFSGDQ